MAKKVKAKVKAAKPKKKAEVTMTEEQAVERYKGILSELDEAVLNIKSDSQKILKGVAKAGRRTRKDWMTLRNLAKEARAITIELTRKSKGDDSGEEEE